MLNDSDDPEDSITAEVEGKRAPLKDAPTSQPSEMPTKVMWYLIFFVAGPTLSPNAKLSLVAADFLHIRSEGDVP